MVTLQTDNRTLALGQNYSFLLSNIQAAVTTITVTNGAFFATDQFVLIGSFGSATAEIRRVTSVAANVITLTAATSFAHSESTKVTIISYDTVGFYQTAGTTFSAGENPLSLYTNVSASGYFTRYNDSVNTTGYGWSRFRNSVSGLFSTPEGPQPYAGYALNSVKTVLDSFYSMMGNNELKLISSEDSFLWLNEAVTKCQNALNLVQQEYTSPLPYTITFVAGTAEYDLPTDFSNVVSLYPGLYPSNPDTYPWHQPIIDIYLDEVDLNNIVPGNTLRYYLRNSKIGFTPTPTTSGGTCTLRYTKRATRLTALTDLIDLPDDNFYLLKDFLVYRAYFKLGNPAATAYKAAFDKSIDDLKIISIKRSDHRDTWGIERSSNV